MKTKKSSIETTFPIHYYYEDAGKKKLVLLLHGYRMHARKALMDFEKMIPSGYSILAPNGFFPIPKSDKSISRMGYSWYFEDHKSGKSIFSVQQAKNTLLTFINSLDLKTKITIIGFSQGAILGLSLATDISNITDLVLMSSAPDLSRFSGSQKLNILAFHGKDDEVIDYHFAKSGYEKLENEGHNLKLISFDKTGHNISSQADILENEIYAFLQEAK